jgi:hypothetical protein
MPRLPSYFAALALGAAAALSGCTTTTAPPGASPLMLDFVWPTPRSPTISLWPDSPPPPKAVIVHWNAKDYSREEIREIAGQQCLTFDRQAAAVGTTAHRNGLAVERFDCVIMSGSTLDHHHG